MYNCTLPGASLASVEVKEFSKQNTEKVTYRGDGPYVQVGFILLLYLNYMAVYQSD